MPSGNLGDRERRADPNNSTTNKETTLLFVGNKGVGKVRSFLVTLCDVWSQCKSIWSELATIYVNVLINLV